MCCGRDESKEENRCGRGQTKRRWDDVNDDDWMADDDAIDSQALASQVVTSHDTEYSLHESVTCHKTVQISSSHRCGYVVRWRNHRCGTWKCVKRIGKYFVGKPRAKCWFRWQQSGDLEAYSDADWEATVSKCGPRSIMWKRCRLPRVSCTPQSRRP